MQLSLSVTLVATLASSKGFVLTGVFVRGLLSRGTLDPFYDSRASNEGSGGVCSILIPFAPSAINLGAFRR